MYRVLDLLRRERALGQPAFDVCIVDSPATDLALALAQIPELLFRIIPRGPIGRDEAYDEGVITGVIRPAAVVPEEAARAILVELSFNSVRADGLWLAEPSRWYRYDRPWPSENPDDATG